MRCTNCGTEFEGNACPNCKMAVEATETNGAKVETMHKDKVNEPPSTPAFNLPKPELPKPKKKIPKRLILEIAGCVLILIFMFVSVGKVSKSDYDKLENKYNSLGITAEKYESEIAELKTVEKEYAEYKKRMEPYEGLEASEAEARKVEADKIAAEKEKADAEKKAADEKVAAEKKAAEDQAAAEAEAKRKAAESASLEQKNALSKAKDYLRYTAFSYSGLIGQLEYEGFSNESATYGADNCGADWNAQAAAKAEDYMNYSSFSRESLIGQLQYEGFTPEQAAHGATAVGY